MRVLRNMATYRLYSLEFTTSIGCPVNCRFCPQSAVLKGYYGDASRDAKPSLLSMKNFQLLFNSRMDEYEERPIVSFCGMGEPFTNPELPSMIRYAYERNSRINLMTTLVGTTKEELSTIKDVSFLLLRIHVPDEEMYAKFAITDEYLAVLDYALNNFRVESLSCHGTVHHSVKEMVTASKLPILRDMHDRAGSVIDPLVNSTPRRLPGRIMCGINPNGFNTLTEFPDVVPSVRPDGSVVPCCMDFGARHVLGNLFTQSWEEILGSESCKAFIQGAFEDKGTLCRTCPCAVPVQNMPAERLKSFLQQDGRNTEELRTLLQKHDPAGSMQKLLAAPYRAVIGLGNVFRKHYFLDLWDEAFEADLFVDNDAAFWGKPIKGIPLPSKTGVVENPAVLKNYPGVLVINFCDREIIETIDRQLDEMQVAHANIRDILRILTHPEIVKSLSS